MATNPVTVWVKDAVRRWPDALVRGLSALCEGCEHVEYVETGGLLSALRFEVLFGNQQPGNHWRSLQLPPMMTEAIALAFPGYGPGIELSDRAHIKRFLRAQGFRNLNAHTWILPKATCEGCSRYMSCVLERPEVAA